MQLPRAEVLEHPAHRLEFCFFVGHMAHEAWKHAYFSNRVLLTHLAAKPTFKSKISITDKEFSSLCKTRALGKMNSFPLLSPSRCTAPRCSLWSLVMMLIGVKKTGRDLLNQQMRFFAVTDGNFTMTWPVKPSLIMSWEKKLSWWRKKWDLLMGNKFRSRKIGLKERNKQEKVKGEEKSLKIEQEWEKVREYKKKKKE